MVVYKLKYNSIKHRIFLLLQYVTIISSIYASGTPVNALYYKESAIAFFLFSFFLFLYSAQKKIINIKKSGVREAIILIVIVICSAIFNFDKDISFYLGIAVLIVGSYLVTISVDYQTYENALVEVFTAIAMISTIITIYLNTHQVYTLHLPRLVTETRNGAVSWGNFYDIYFVWDYWGRFGFIRNSACFREPGVWGAFCVLVLGIKILELKSKKNRSRKDNFQIIVLSIGTLTSFSTPSIICYIICMLMLYYNGSRTNKKSLIIGGCVLIASIVIIIKYSDVLFLKFVSGTSEYKAFSDRFVGINNSIKAFLQNPVVGAGYTKYYAILQGAPLTVSFIVILGEYGVLGFSWFLLHLISFCRMISSRLCDFVLLILMVSIILVSQNISFMPLYLIICLYASSYKALTIHKI